jgi:hypothetical protein
MKDLGCLLQDLVFGLSGQGEQSVSPRFQVRVCLILLEDLDFGETESALHPVIGEWNKTGVGRKFAVLFVETVVCRHYFDDFIIIAEGVH